jgi:hypothetical protein
VTPVAITHSPTTIACALPDDDLHQLRCSQRAIEHDLACPQLFRNTRDCLMAASEHKALGRAGEKRLLRALSRLPPAVTHTDIDRKRAAHRSRVARRARMRAAMPPTAPGNWRYGAIG